MPRPVREHPWLSKRGEIWQVNWYEPGEAVDGKRTPGRTRTRSLDTDDFTVAQRRFAAFLTRKEELAPAVGASGLLTVESALNLYEIEHVNRKVVDKVRQRNAIVHLKAYFGTTPLRDLDIPASRGYAEARRSGVIGGGKRHSGDRAKGSDSTIRRELHVLVAAINHAKRWKRLEATDQPTVELPSEAPPEDTKWLTKDELNEIFAAAEGTLADFIAIAYFTSARRNSIETLRVEQIDLANRRINLRKAGEVATKKRRPIVPMHAKIEAILARLTRDAGPDGYLFGPSADFYKAFRALCRSAGIGDDRAHPHVLRHSRATHLLMSKTSIYDVARLLGDTVGTVERVYGHHSTEYLMASTSDS